MTREIAVVRAPQTAALKGPARVLRRRSVAVDRWATYVETERKILRHSPVLVFSMGKAGTTSLAAAVEATGRPVLKAHSLTREGIDARLANEQSRAEGERPRFLWRTNVIRWDLRWRTMGRWQVISAVRDPVARTISAYFYSRGSEPALRHSLNDLQPHGREVERILVKIAVEQDWFAEELGAATGLDVYAQPFDVSAGYQMYENDRFRAVLIRQEDLEERGAEALSSLLRNPVVMPRRRLNSGAAATYRALYERFRNEWQFDRELLKRVYGHRAVAHFYTEDELARMLARWTHDDQDTAAKNS